MLIRPPLWFIGYCVALFAFTAGWTINGWRHKSREAKALEEAYKQRDAANLKANNLAADYELIETALDETSRNTTEKVRVIYRDRKISADCAIPAGAAGLLNDARNNANAAIAGQSGNALPDNPASSGN